MCTYGMVPLQIHRATDVESVPTLQIQFTYVKGLINDTKRGLTETEERGFTVGPES